MKLTMISVLVKGARKTAFAYAVVGTNNKTIVSKEAVDKLLTKANNGPVCRGQTISIN